MYIIDDLCQNACQFVCCVANDIITLAPFYSTPNIMGKDTLLVIARGTTEHKQVSHFQQGWSLQQAPVKVI